MANVSDVNRVLKPITGIGNIATSVRKLTGKNYGRLLREFGGYPALNDALYSLSGIAGTLPEQMDQYITEIEGANLNGIGYCGQCYDFNGSDCYLDIDVPNSPATLVQRFNNKDVMSIGFYINNNTSASKQTLVMGNNNYPFRVSIGTDNLIEIRCGAYSGVTVIASQTVKLGEIPQNEWSVNLITMDFANQQFTHYVNGAQVSGIWPTAWNNPNVEYKSASLVDQVLRVGGQTNDTEYLDGQLAGIFVVPTLCTPAQAEAYFADFAPQTCGDGIFFQCDESKPTNVGSGQWVIYDSTGTVSGVLTSTDTTGLVYLNGIRTPGIFQKMINEEGHINFRNQLGHILIEETPTLNGTGLTIAGWLKYTTPADAMTYPWYAVSGANTILASTVNAVGAIGVTATISGSPGNVVTIGKSPDTWYHMAYVVDTASSGLLYIDGNVEASFDATPWAGFNFGNLNFMLGATQDKGSNRNNTTQTGFALVNEALSREKLVNLANITKPRGVNNVQ